MEVVNTILDSVFKSDRSILTIGGFDGIHLGHRQIIECGLNLSKKNNLPLVVITFDPLPKYFFNSNLTYLMSTEEKIRKFNSMAIDYLVMLKFDSELSNRDAYTFLSDIVNRFKPKYIVSGSDHRFGLDRKGSIDFLESHSNRFGYSLKVVPDYKIGDLEIRSSLIRRMIETSDVYNASRLLGYNYFIKGEVVKGDGLGRELGFPTANIVTGESKVTIPANGVYCVNIEYDSNSFKGMCNIGIRPTVVNDGLRRIEVHIFSKEDIDLYGQKIKIYFIDFIRSEVKYETKGELIKQLNEDKKKCLNMN